MRRHLLLICVHKAPQCALCRVLNLLAQHCPGLLEAHLLLATTLYLAGRLESAQLKVADVLRINPDEFEAHLLAANIFLCQVQGDMPHVVVCDQGF